MSVFFENNCGGQIPYNLSQVSTPKVANIYNSCDELERKIRQRTTNVSKDLVAAAGFNVEAPIVSAIIGNIAGTLPTKRNDSMEKVKCDICDCEISSKIILEYHLNGSKHKKKAKALEILQQLKGEKGVKVDENDSLNTYRCEICCLTVNSVQQLEFHLAGGKHKRKAAKLNSGNGSSNENENDDDNRPSKKKKKEPKEIKVIACDICNIFMNSETQYIQHLSSKKHNKRRSPL